MDIADIIRNGIISEADRLTEVQAATPETLNSVWFDARTHSDYPPFQWHDDENEDDLNKEEVGL